MPAGQSSRKNEGVTAPAPSAPELLTRSGAGKRFVSEMKSKGRRCGRARVVHLVVDARDQLVEVAVKLVDVIGIIEVSSCSVNPLAC